MNRAVLTITLATCASLVSTTAQAAAWNVPTNMRVVQKSNIDTSGRVYGNIQQAIDSISGASATNPFVVKVMPGVYDLGTGTLSMKPHVDVEGSGPENTIVTSSNNNVDGSTCTVGTVLMANDSAIRNIRVVNRAPALGGAYTTVAALVFNNVKAKAEHMTIMTGSDTAVGGQNNGACTYGPFADATLNDVTIEARNNSNGLTTAIIAMGGRLIVTNSKLSAFNAGGWCDVINDNTPYLESTTILINNTTIEGACGTAVAIYSNWNHIRISDSTLVLNVGASGSAVPFQASGGTELSMTSSRILVSGAPATYWFGSPDTVKIATTELPGDLSQFVGVKLVSDYDANFNPITNQ
jgi:pectin methylesterase-like acyl-CoA thioesterase